MPTKKFAIDPGGPERLSVSGHGNFKDFEIAFDDQPVGSLEDAKALKEGGRFTLSDGSTLEVKLASPMLVPELQIDRDGAPVPGSAGHPETRHRNAYNMVFVIAGFNAVIGLLGVLTGASFFRALGVGWASVATGIVYAVLGFFVKRGLTIAPGPAVGRGGAPRRRGPRRQCPLGARAGLRHHVRELRGAPRRRLDLPPGERPEADAAAPREEPRGRPRSGDHGLPRRPRSPGPLRRPDAVRGV
jgi:hypothetical protein